MYFAAHCAGSKGLAPGTIFTITYMGQHLYCLACVLRGIKKCHQVEHAKRLPLTIPIMCALVGR